LRELLFEFIGAQRIVAGDEVGKAINVVARPRGSQLELNAPFDLDARAPSP